MSNQQHGPVDPSKLSQEEKRELIATYRSEIAHAHQEMYELTEQLRDIQMTFVNDTQQLMSQMQALAHRTVKQTQPVEDEQQDNNSGQ